MFRRENSALSNAATFVISSLQAPMFMCTEEPTMKFVEISAMRVASQLTLIEHEVFSRIKPL